MANPFLVLGGIAVGIITAAFGILQVPGWVAQAQDASAINDLSMISAAQAASASLTGEYAADLGALQDGGLGLSFTVPGGRVQHFSADGDGWCSVALSDSGRYFGVSSADPAAVGAGSLDAAISAVCGTGPSVPNEEEPEPETPPAEAEPKPDPPTADVLTYTVRSDTNINFALSLMNPRGTVTWSDDVHQMASGKAPVRTISAGVTYQVTFVGDYDGFPSASTPEAKATNASIRSMDTWVSVDGTAAGACAFMNMTNLTDVPENIPALTDAYSMFRGASKINDPDISGWDISNVTNLSGTFADATAFNQDLTRWNTSKVTSLQSTFTRARAFNQDLSRWDTSKVTTMEDTFLAATAFNGDITGWVTSNVTTLYRTFYAAAGFNRDISGWDTSKVKDMEQTFYNASSFAQNLSGWTVSASTYRSGFSTGSKMTAADLPRF